MPEGHPPPELEQAWQQAGDAWLGRHGHERADAAGEFAMVCEALWTVLEQRGGTDPRLLRLIDAYDGLRTAAERVVRCADAYVDCLAEFAEEPGGMATCGEYAHHLESALEGLARLAGVERSGGP